MATIEFETEEEKIQWKSAFTCNCEKCGNLTEYSIKFDAWYCPECDLWAESKCKDPECIYCKDRPTKPSEIKEIISE